MGSEDKEFCMRRLKLVVFGLFCSVLLAWGGAAAQRRAGYVGNLRNNSCVKCHSSLREPLKISVHFFDWKNSRHDKAGVSCEKCHGGDPAAATMKAAHIGVSSPSAAGSPRECTATRSSFITKGLTLRKATAENRMF